MKYGMHFRTRLFTSCLILTAAASAQQGHPLTGTWSGDWGDDPSKRAPITMVLNWDGKQVSGLMNPGPNAIAISSVYVDPVTWTIRFEAEAKDGRIAADGKLDDIGSYHRTISGTWHQGNAQGRFKLTRD